MRCCAPPLKTLSTYVTLARVNLSLRADLLTLEDDCHREANAEPTPAQSVGSSALDATVDQPLGVHRGPCDPDSTPWLSL